MDDVFCGGDWARELALAGECLEGGEFEAEGEFSADCAGGGDVVGEVVGHFVDFGDEGGVACYGCEGAFSADAFAFVVGGGLDVGSA